jgi:hypothetical protein
MGAAEPMALRIGSGFLKPPQLRDAASGARLIQITLKGFAFPSGGRSLLVQCRIR